MEYLNLLNSIYFCKIIELFIFIICIISFVLVFALLFEEESIIRFLIQILFAFIFLMSFIHLGEGVNFYKKNINYNIQVQNIKVSFLPNQIVNSDIDTFIVNEKKLEVTRINDVKYIQDSKEQPYIVVEKVTYEAPYKWYVNKKNIEEINSTEKYILKEIHY